MPALSSRPTPTTWSMPVQIGSNAEMMTAVVLMQLQEEGAMTLTATANDPACNQK